MDEKDIPTLLIIILNIDSLVASKSANSNDVDVNEVLSAVVLFCNSYCLMHRGNKLVFLANVNESVRIIYPEEKDENLVDDEDGNSVCFVKSSVVLKSLHDAILETKHDRTFSDSDLQKSFKNSSLSQCFSNALCMVNRERKQQVGVIPIQCRILVLQFAKDSAQSYNSLMNSIFSAQKLNVCVDALICSKSDSHLMQQACFLTGGYYHKHKEGGTKDLLQLLHMRFLVDKACRQHLSTPLLQSVDFKASCHCHRKPVEFAYMCSVCLALSCDPADQCSVCDTPAKTINN